MEKFLSEILNVDVVKSLGECSGGCISNGASYLVGDEKVFVKRNSQFGADIMFHGEFESLKAIANTKTVKVPTPIKLCKVSDSKDHMFIMENLEMKSLSNYQQQLGYDIANLHLHNIRLLKETKRNDQNVTSQNVEAVEKFGFHTTTCCGLHPIDNTWSKDWMEFYCQRRLQLKIDAISQQSNDRELNELWSELQLIIDKLFTGISIHPSLLHGDLWGGNAAETDHGPVVFDASSCYGHHEFELSITNMFGGFNQEFFKAYHSIIPKSTGFDGRHDLYVLFHYLNHWHHFGSGYRSSSILTMKNVLKKIKSL